MQKLQFVHRQQLSDSSGYRWIVCRSTLIHGPEMCNPFIFNAPSSKSYIAGSFIEALDRLLKSHIGQPFCIPRCQNRAGCELPSASGRLRNVVRRQHQAIATESPYGAENGKGSLLQMEPPHAGG
jgi:hypothetical protein